MFGMTGIGREWNKNCTWVNVQLLVIYSIPVFLNQNQTEHTVFPSSLTFSLNLQIMPSFCTLSLFSVVSSSQVWDGKVVKKIPVTYNCLSFINIERINHVTGELVYVLHLLLQSPNLENLQISISYLSKLFVYTLTCS